MCRICRPPQASEPVDNSAETMPVVEMIVFQWLKNMAGSADPAGGKNHPAISAGEAGVVTKR
jgi:hypothetical protein